MDVVETVKEVRGHLSFGPTKTNGRRSVGLPRFLVDELDEHLKARRPQHPDDLVFVTPTGLPIRHGWFYKTYFKPAVHRAGLPGALRLHDLRHTAAALLIAEGAHPRAIMERLGHSSVTVSLDVYGHLFASIDESLTDALDRLYRDAGASSCGADVVQHRAVTAHKPA